MKKPYIRRYCKVGKFVVWIVDGTFIRKNIDEEFTNFGQHYRFKFIPENEFWIDKEHGRGREERFFIEHMIVENRLMAKGISYSKAVERAGAVERAERRKSEKSFFGFRKKALAKRVHRELLDKYSSDKLKIWVVYGKRVRDLFYTDFTEGGHDKVYDFVPEREVWLDDDVSKKERKFVLLHEIYERNLMCKGMKYEDAHRSASRIEHYCRMHPDKLDEKINLELNKIK